MEEMRVEMLPVEQLTPYERNARAHGEDDIAALMESIRIFGFRDPIGVWGPKNIIVEGHGRLMAAKRLGLPEVPVIRLDDMSDEERRAYALAHNRTAELSRWDETVREMELAGIDEIDMSAFRFDVEHMTTELESVIEDEPPEPPTEPKTKMGDLWQLGNHRLICGDCTDPTILSKLMDGQVADISITSPPYGVINSSNLRRHYVKGKSQKKSFYESFDDDPNGWGALICESFEQMTINSQAQFVNIQMLADNKRDLLRFVSDNSNRFVDIIIWDKLKAPPQMQRNVLNNQFEFIFIFGNQNRCIPFSKFHGDKNNVISIPVGNNEFSEIHRAVFPVALPCEILNIAIDAESVLDVFGGTGTTMIACEQMNRNCYMCELEPKYVDVIIHRWENFTGKKAVLLNDAESLEYQN